MLPPLSAYHNAIASPRQAFVDPELRLAKPAALRMGLPVAMVGGFAATYRLVTPSGDVAVRCFHRESPDLSARYNHISKALATSPSPHMVKFDFQPRGIMVEGQAYPIVRMEWAKGKVLSSVLREQHGNREVLAALIRQLNRVEQSLRSLGISHGDLQPENIIWDGTSLRLLDYDGMFVPGMTPGRSAELGQRHFQHPGRSAGTFGPDMDRFSFITLALSLRALMARSSLYNEYAVTDENILFQASDYKDPSQSRAFMELLHIAEIREHVKRFEAICRGPVSEVPTLEEFVNLRPRSNGVPSSQPSVASNQPQVPPTTSGVGIGATATMPAADYERAGRYVTSHSPITIVGAVHSCRSLKDGYRLYFSDCTLSGVVVTLKDEAEEKYRRIASDFNQHVVITSRVNEVKRKYTMATSQESVHVHMVVSDPSVIRCVTKSEAATYTHNARPSESVDYAGYGSEPRPPPDLPPPQDFIFTTNTIAPAVAEYLPVQTVPPPPVVESVPRPSNVPPRPHTWSNRVLARVARLICWAFGLGRRP